MRSLKSKLISLTLIATIIFFGIGFITNQALNTKLNLQQTELDYSIQSGKSLSAVIYDLANKDIIAHPRLLLWYIRLYGLSNKMQAGDYRLTQDLTAAQFLDNIFKGKVIQYSLTVIEGWSFSQLIDALNKHEQIKHTIQNLSLQEIIQKLGVNESHYEGLFLPDTYYFPKNLTDIDFLKRAYNEMKTVLEYEWNNRETGLLYKNPYEALIMASIVEKETGLASERSKIAGVFIRRLEKNMRLQTDPTVIYGMGENYKGNIRKSDLLKETPYNTYRRNGLPPTPIALPGKDAIHAALHPEAGETLYFVSRGDGSHVFSATLDEHNKAVIKYQLKGRVRSFSSFNDKSEK